ncbi:TolB family protein, partial [Salmonella sp. SAL4431]|uniref:TolB family protein n=1 Tax=Salmonella sp. SAL4431 TaxID=3159886 RepID=UPI0039799FBC
IYTIDARTAEAIPLITGPEEDLEPRFSLDGTKIAYQRTVEGGMRQVFVAHADGSDPTLVTPEPLDLAPVGSGRGWEHYAFSP